MNEPSRSAILNKLIWLSIVCAAGIIAFLLFFHQSFSTSLQREKKDQSKQLSEVGIGIIRYFHGLELAGKLSSTEAKRFSSNALRSATYGDNGYFWINSGEGILLMQPYTPELVGINQIEWTDSQNNYIFKEFITKAKTGGGWVEYHWPKPNTKQQVLKLSYVDYFPPWDWVLGTGLYLDDTKDNVFKSVLQASGILIFCFIIFITLAIFLANYFIKQLEGLAVRDHLTGLFTKRFLQETLPSILKKNRRNKNQFLAAIFIDIDHFKRINDNYGHSCGDQVLSRIAKTIQANTRPDDLCIRYGGEEFIVVGTFKNTQTLIGFAERIRVSASHLTFTYNTNEFQVTLSAGIAMHHGDDSFDDTLSRADQKLYEAKVKGRDCIVI